jgi:hypothetical protein
LTATLFTPNPTGTGSDREDTTLFLTGHPLHVDIAASGNTTVKLLGIRVDRLRFFNQHIDDACEATPDRVR